jgi:hypothetical protein
MKLRITLLAMVAAAGVLASIAVAKPPPGHGNNEATTTGTTATSTTGTTTTESGKGEAAKVLVCHKVGNGHYVLVKVSAHSARAKGKHGDVLATNGTCPGPLQGHGSKTTTGATTTTVATTTTTP